MFSLKIKFFNTFQIPIPAYIKKMFKIYENKTKTKTIEVKNDTIFKYYYVVITFLLLEHKPFVHKSYI